MGLFNKILHAGEGRKLKSLETHRREYERLIELCHLTEDQLTVALFGPSPALFGLVAIEAQACGTPVVAARVGGASGGRPPSRRRSTDGRDRRRRGRDPVAAAGG